MKKFFWGVVILAGLSLAGTAVYFSWPVGRQEAATQYQCPMHPHVISDKPGTCPICGMTLVPVAKPEGAEGTKGDGSAGHQHPDSSIQLPLERRQWIGLKTAVIAKKSLRVRLRLPGRVAFDREMYVTQNEYVSSLKWGGGDDLRGIIEKKMERLGLSEEELAQMRKTKKADDALFLPKIGGPFWVYAAVYEGDAGSVSAGMEAAIELPSDRSIVRTGLLRAVTPILDPMTRTVQARIFAADFSSEFKPETYVDVVLEKDLGEGLAVPKDAVIETGVEQIVFVDLGEGFLEPRAVKLGAKAGDDYPVVEGLAEGEKVVTSAQFLLDSEAQLQQALKKFGAMGGGAMKGHQH